ncbi:low temperature requirement protein A [Streptomyces sp. A5-4]|uniref:low temperature requirement protein A n=1 Tax=Streptomyces sp. A5-4 TaxID=3384771 RepID=UPI003DA8F5F9
MVRRADLEADPGGHRLATGPVRCGRAALARLGVHPGALASLALGPGPWALGPGHRHRSDRAADRVLPSHPASRQRAARPHRRAPGPAPGSDPALVGIEEAHTENAHLAERLGLYLIIVLGEGIIQVIDAAAEHEQWSLPLAATALGAFALLTTIWTLSLLYGYDGVPQLHARALSPRRTLVLHAALTATLAVLAATLGIAVTHADGALPTSTRKVLCGAMILYFLIGLAAALTSNPGRAWLLGRALPCVLVPVVLLSPAGRHLSTPLLVWVLALTVGWQILYDPGPPATTRRRSLPLPHLRHDRGGRRRSRSATGAGPPTPTGPTT